MTIPDTVLGALAGAIGTGIFALVGAALSRRYARKEDRLSRLEEKLDSTSSTMATSSDFAAHEKRDDTRFEHHEIKVEAVRTELRGDIRETNQLIRETKVEILNSIRDLVLPRTQMARRRRKSAESSGASQAD